MSHKEQTEGISVGFAVGLLIGVAMGILYAPRSGKETRGIIKDRAEVTRDKAEKIVEEAKQKAETIIENAREKASEMRQKKEGAEKTEATG